MSEPEQIVVRHGDCLDLMRELADDSVDAIVTDPPYGLGFMGKAWDDLPPGLPWAQECLRVLKPGGHLLAFGGTRTWHRLACAVEDAGFEVRDSIAWLYGSGFPKSLDVSKAIDKAAGAAREIAPGRHGAAHSIVAIAGNNRECVTCGRQRGGQPTNCQCVKHAAPATDDARTWQGWGTALKPAFEPIVVARKPLIGPVAANVLAHGTGALNVDATRIKHSSEADLEKHKRGVDAIKARGGVMEGSWKNSSDLSGASDVSTAGRWPANVVLDERQAKALDEQSGTLTSGAIVDGSVSMTGRRSGIMGEVVERTRSGYGASSGGASRFFYTAKADSAGQRDECAVRERVESVLDGPTISGADRARIRQALAANCECAPCPGRGDDGHRMTHCAECCFGSGVEADMDCPIHGIDTRFMYVAKAPKKERPVVDGIAHPTVKPLTLMRWLVRLVTPPGGLVLDPFAGSGTTGEAALLEGFRCLLFEREADYLPLIAARLARHEPAELDELLDDPRFGIGVQMDMLDLLNEETA